MLCLSRKQDQVIAIGRDIEVRVLAIKNGVVKLGISAPRNVPVHRQEVAEKIKEQGKN